MLSQRGYGHVHVAAASRLSKQIVIETPPGNKPIGRSANSFMRWSIHEDGREPGFLRYDGQGIWGNQKDSAEEIVRLAGESGDGEGGLQKEWRNALGGF